MSNPFDYVTAASYSKKDLMSGTENDKLAEAGYNPWLTNRAFSNFPDTVLHANEMNRLYELENAPQFYYYINILRPKKRFKKFFKSEQDDNITLICNAFDCNKRVAKQYLDILSHDQLTLLKQKEEKGGVE